jgi:hypothetical protein
VILIHKFFIIGRKTTAASFILLIGVANYWLIQRFTGHESSEWSLQLFILGAIAAGLGFLMMVPEWVKPSKLMQESSEIVERDAKDH